MDIDEENSASTLVSEPSTGVSDNNVVVSAISPIPQSVPPVVPPVLPLPGVPSIAPIPSVPPQLAPLPAIPSILRTATAQNGEAGISDSDSDQDEAGSSHTASGPALEYEISEESRQARERQEKAKQDFLMKRRAMALAVPTNDKAVRQRLRLLGEPVTFFGEREMERRDRLRTLMAELDSKGQLEKLMKALDDAEASGSAAPAEGPEEDIQYPFFTEGPKSLLQARIEIAKYSIVKAALRLHRAKRRRDDPDEDYDAEVDFTMKQAESLVLDCSEIGDDRPLSGCSLSHDGSMLATWYIYTSSVLLYLFVHYLLCMCCYMDGPVVSCLLVCFLGGYIIVLLSETDDFTRLTILENIVLL